MSKNLVIVESPAKAKTIEKFLGKEFKVASSFGHISDLPSNELGVNMDDENAGDDIITREVHLVVGEPVLLKMRSQDVIHSAFLPHFRVQMNCVPGMTTQFGFTPTQTVRPPGGGTIPFTGYMDGVVMTSHEVAAARQAADPKSTTKVFSPTLSKICGSSFVIASTGIETNTISAFSILSNVPF